MQSVEIKVIHHKDFDIWLPLWKGYQRFYEVDIPEPVTLKTWARFLDPVSRGCLPNCAPMAAGSAASALRA